ncbi:MAG: histidine kinase [Bacteroidales bacterium]|nr:histidine kinase [Bacteroidales bacterium]
MKFNKKILIACIVIALLMPAFFYLKFYLTDNNKPMHNIALGMLYSFIVSVSIFTVNIKIFNWLRLKFPWDKKFIQRISSEILLTNFIAVIIISICALIFSLAFNHFGNQKLSIVLFNNIIVAIIINTISISILEGYYYFKQWKTSLIQTEQLKRENIQSQFEALKNQIDPHFLFNSMNTIYSLIDTHPDKAKEFITKFSKTYRYVLDVKEKVVVSLKDEIEFLKSYIFLQKIRHEGNLEISINIDAQKLNNYIPPLSLQMLVENAIKHNIISENKPLKIKIFNNSNSLIVKNNLQPKDSINESTKIGLNNLSERYKYISKKAPRFYIKDNEYIAEIPILKEE